MGFVKPKDWKREHVENAVQGLLLLSLLALAVRHAWMFRLSTYDDPFITYRYAVNVANLDGFVFNPGERVEGTSSFLLTLLLAIAFRFGADIPHVSQVVGVASYLVIVVLVFFTARRLLTGPARVLLPIGAALLIVASTRMAFYSISGFETMLYTLFLLIGFFTYVVSLQENTESRGWPLWMGAAAITRPEGFVYFVLLWLLDVSRFLWMERSFKKAALRAIPHLAWFSVVFGPVLLFRLLYFGSWLPNSVVAKNGFSQHLLEAPWSRLWDIVSNGSGWKKIVQIHAQYGVLLSVGVLVFTMKSVRYIGLVLVSSCCVGLALFIWNDGDWMAHGRLLVPNLPMLILTVILGLGTLFRLARKNRVVTLALLLAAASAVAILADKSYYLRESAERRPTIDYLRKLGEALAKVRTPQDLLVSDTVGIVPYYSMVRTLDTLGLCDSHIARHGKRLGVMGKTDPAYVAKHRPTFIVYNTPNNLRELFRNRAFAGNRNGYYLLMDEYNRNAGRGEHKRDKRKWLLVHKSHPNLEQLRRLLDAELTDPIAQARKIGVRL